jgi:hypothetical protein
MPVRPIASPRLIFVGSTSTPVRNLQSRDFGAIVCVRLDWLLGFDSRLAVRVPKRSPGTFPFDAVGSILPWALPLAGLTGTAVETTGDVQPNGLDPGSDHQA